MKPAKEITVYETATIWFELRIWKWSLRISKNSGKREQI